MLGSAVWSRRQAATCNASFGSRTTSLSEGLIEQFYDECWMEIDRPISDSLFFYIEHLESHKLDSSQRKGNSGSPNDFE